MRLKDGFLVHSGGSESFLIPSGAVSFSGLVRGNAVLGVLLSKLEKGATREELVAALAAEYDAPVDRLRADVDKLLTELRSIDALEEGT